MKKKRRKMSKEERRRYYVNNYLSPFTDDSQRPLPKNAHKLKEKYNAIEISDEEAK